MPITIRVELNGKEIASAKAVNLSSLADVSDYYVAIKEAGSSDLGIPEINAGRFVTQHARRQSVWALVEKIAIAAKGRQ